MYTNKQKAALARAKPAARERMRREYQQQGRRERPMVRTPQPKAKPANRRKPATNGGKLGFNAFTPDAMPLAFSVGRATRLQGLERADFPVKGTLVGQTHTVVVLNGAPGHVVGQVYEVNKNTTNNNHTLLSTLHMTLHLCVYIYIYIYRYFFLGAPYLGPPSL